MSNEDSSAGRPRRVSDRELIRTVADILEKTSDPVATTAEIEERIPLSRRGLLTRLRDLEDEGVLGSKQVGARGRVWWVPDE